MYQKSRTTTPWGALLTAVLCLSIPLTLCSCEETDDDTQAGDDDTGDDDSAGDDDSGDDDAGDDDASQFPADPSPFTLTISGTDSASILFSAGSCQIYPPPSNVNFMQFWRDPSHNAVLVAEIRGPYTGAGTYDETMSTTRVKLLTEAGSTYNFAYQSDPNMGDTTQIDIAYSDPEDVVWGEFTFSGLSGGDGAAITGTPQPLPIWCPEVMNGN